MTERRRFTPLNSSSNPTHDTLRRRKPSRRTFRELAGSFSIPPVPYPGIIMRFMKPTAITDTESLQTTTDWAAGNYKNAVAVSNTYPIGGIQFVGTEFACYVYTLDVPAGSGESIVMAQPIRWTINEAASNGSGFEMWKTGTFGGATPGLAGGYDFTSVERNDRQPFSSNEFLPASGNSHADDSDPYAVGMVNMVEACQSHVVYVNGQYIENSAGVNVIRPAKWYIRAAYARWRINGTAVGPLHSLLPLALASNPAASTDGLYPDTGISGDGNWLQPFPSGHPLWTEFQSYLENWNLEFASGDSIEVDVWYQIGAKKDPLNGRKLCISIPRYATNNNQQISNTASLSPPSGYFLRGNQGIVPAVMNVYGINMSPGFDPKTHTYNFDPQDGAFSFGKAQAAGAIRFVITSKRLEWTFNETFAACGGTSTWQVQEVDAALQWVLIVDNCTGGGVAVAPTSDPSEAGIEETTACNCSTAPAASAWRVTLELVYEYEIAYLKASIERTSSPAIGGVLYYRPESTGDYVNQVNDRWTGNQHCGETGVFNHLGVTTFRYWKGVQSVTTYNTSFPTALASISSMLPTTILVTKVAQ